MRRTIAGDLELDDDAARVDVDVVCRYLSEEAYWAPGRSREVIERLVRDSTRVLAAYDGTRLVGFARVMSDGANMAWLGDVFVLAGIWAILGHFSDLGQVDSLFVTAVLTSVAFSIHDTIVVFDRVRENLRVGPRLTFDQVINLSTVQTMTRSLNTSLTVVFVLLSLVIFGGDSIRGFVLALLIGIVSGTYSSIFNASTLLVAWEKARASRSTAPPAGRRRVVTRTA